MECEEDYYLAFSECPGIGPRRFDLLLARLGSAGAAWKSDRGGYETVGLRGAWVEEMLRFRQSYRHELVREKLVKAGVGFISRVSDGFPESLLTIDTVPIGLYVKGDVERLGNLADEVLVAVVGTRKITDYGKRVTRDLSRALTAAGVGIVSGMMYGVDEVAHFSCIEEGGFTIGVWAGGIDTVLVGSRGVLATEILDSGGVLVSEYGLGSAPHKLTFPARNRIVSGLSRGVLVTEGSQGSGTLITAGFAAAQGKEVFAVPGPITSLQSAAPSSLIKMGATLVTSVEDILESLHIKSGGRVKIDLGNLSVGERCVYELLRNGISEVNDLCREMEMEVGGVSGLLLMLELKGVVCREGNLWSVSGEA